MAISATIQAALNRLRSYYNGSAYDAVTNPGGLGRGGHRVNLVQAFKDFGESASAVSIDLGSVETNTILAQQARDQALAARDQCQAIADSIAGGGSGGGSTVGGSDVVNKVSFAPSLDFRFTEVGGWVGNVVRAGNGTYFSSDGVLRTAGANVTRLTYDPYTGQPEGVIVEQNAVTNLFFHSEDFTQSVWVKGSTVVTANNGRAPDATDNADLINGAVYQDVALASGAGGWRSFTVFVQGVAATSITLAVRYFNSGGQVTTEINGSATINLSTGVITPSGSSSLSAATAYVKRLPGGLYRIGVSMEGGFNNNAIRCTITPNASARVWGAMLEASRVPSSYVASGASNGTRSAETFVLPFNLGPYDPAEGTVYAEFYHSGYPNAAANTGILQLDAGSNTDSIQLRTVGTAAEIEFGVNNGSTFGSRPLSSGINRVAAGWSTFTTDAMAVNSQAIESFSIGNPVTAPTTLRLGVGNGVGGNGIYRRVVLWPKRATDSVLVQMATP